MDYEDFVVILNYLYFQVFRAHLLDGIGTCNGIHKVGECNILLKKIRYQ
jgi:hypothetical protein